MKLNENASMRQRGRIRGKAGRPASGLKTDETWYSSANHFTALCSRDLETVVMTESFLQIPSTTSKEADWCRRLVPRNRSTQFFVHGFSWKNGKLGSILYSYTLARQIGNLQLNESFLIELRRMRHVSRTLPPFYIAHYVTR